jgi:ABC-type transporter Mla subunit MlaD
MISPTAFALALAGALLSLASCASTGAELSASTVSSLDSLSDEVEKANEQIKATMAALNELTKTTDLGAKYKTYTSELARLESTANRSAKNTESMITRAKTYFTAWEDQLDNITSPIVRKLSQERGEAALERFERLSANVQAVKESVDVLLLDLIDIRVYLDFNLNAEGVSTAKPLFAQARSDAAIVRELQAQVNSQLLQVSGAMSAKISP